MRQKISVKEVAHHRNGISGESFHVVLFDWWDADERCTRNMMATLFRVIGQCAVLDVGETARGNIAFACGNSWRGDNFEDDLRQAVTDYHEGCLAKVG